MTEQKFDLLNRLAGVKTAAVTTVDASGQGQTDSLYRCLRYDLAGNLLEETDLSGDAGCYEDPQAPLEIPGRVTSHTYDPLNRRLATTDRAGRTVAWSYDGLPQFLSPSRTRARNSAERAR